MKNEIGPSLVTHRPVAIKLSGGGDGKLIDDKDDVGALLPRRWQPHFKMHSFCHSLISRWRGFPVSQPLGFDAGVDDHIWHRKGVVTLGFMPPSKRASAHQ
ncbi:hypothetical protein GCM10009102_29160 [Sphingomonas insulae]|uniref:Uncharacterized protein n=1 Tax=Sphingomonas insulae TaxID=424800 RepID=A0ABN1HZ83_9SPHN